MGAGFLKARILVSRARRGILHAAPQNRDRHKGSIRNGPGSAAHHAAKGGALRSIRGTAVVAFIAKVRPQGGTPRNHGRHVPSTGRQDIVRYSVRNGLGN
uniref:Uncharacterized protein n=1 Tax=Rhodopseudomonas palustris (strain BisA53) TaxID=316055 RepID=Q07I71_RHOP5